MLPKLDTPTYRLTLPSTGDEIQYRPFLVKEQKLLESKESVKKSSLEEMMSLLVHVLWTNLV